MIGGSYVPMNQGVIHKHPYKNFNLYFWSDQHFGAVECNYELAKDIVDMIKKDKTSLVVLGGDTMEAIPKGYKYDDTRGQDVPPDVQILETAKHLEPVAKQVVCLFKGNHNIQMRGESIDSDLMLASSLKIKYKTVPTVIQVKVPNGVIKLAGGHGRSGAKNGDTELQTVRTIYPNCDIYFLGHNHQLYAKQIGAIKYDVDGNEEWDSSWFVRTGNCLSYAEYARYSFYNPQRSGCVRFSIKDGKIDEDGVHIITNEYFKRK